MLFRSGSYYLGSKPLWFGNFPLPAFGPDPSTPSVLLDENIPAKYCYDQNKMPTCLLSVTGTQDNIVADNSVRVFPNPCKSSAVIYSDQKNCSITIMDITGSVVKNITGIEQFPFSFERGNLASGIYILELRNENKIQRSKLVVE